MPPALPGAACVLLTLPRVLPAKSDQFSFLLPFLGNESSGTRTELASSPGGGKMWDTPRCSLHGRPRAGAGVQPQGVIRRDTIKCSLIATRP